MKRGTRLAAMAAVLTALLAAWMLARGLTRQREEQTAAEAAEIPIGVGSAEDVSAIAWDYLGDEVRLEKRGGVWVNAADETCPIDQQAVAPLVRAAAEAKADGLIEDVTDFAQYGLADPAITVEATAGDRTVTYGIGGIAVSGACYVRIDGGSEVYTETGTLPEVFAAQLDDLLALESPPEMEEVTALTVHTDVEDYTAVYRPEGCGYTDAYTWFHGEVPLDAEKARALYELASRVQLRTCVTWNAEDLAPYGLDAPQGTACVSYRDSDGESHGFTLVFGDYTQDGYVYVRIADSKMVYLVSGTVLDGLMYPDWEDMRPMNILPLDWEELQSFTLEREEERYEITRREDGVYTLQGRTLDSALADSWLQEIYAFTAESAAPDARGREELLRLTFRLDREACPTVTVTIWSYDSARCLCAVNGEMFLVSRTAAASLWDDAEDLLASTGG